MNTVTNHFENDHDGREPSFHSDFPHLIHPAELQQQAFEEVHEATPLKDLQFDRGSVASDQQSMQRSSGNFDLLKPYKLATSSNIPAAGK